ncbi:MAG: aldo/keto reductase [Clostridia bacterium]|nr:aldo/keto reductase [Clostridia bacterium]
MRALEKRTIERMDHTQVTFLGLGALEIGRNWGMGTDTERPDEHTAGRVLNEALDAGLNLIDTASAYHRSEERIGQFVSGRRNEFVLASKCGEHSCEPGTYYDFSYEAVTRSIDESLRKLRTDVIDLMQIHFGPDPEAVIRNGETVRAMKDAQKAGKIRFLGASIDGKLAEECIRSGDFDVMQMAYNLSNRGNEANIALARERGIGVLVRCGMGNGLFTPRVLLSPDRLSEDVRRRLFDSLDQIGGDPEQAIQTLMAINLRFLYENPGISSVIVGTKKPENIRKNMALLEQKTEDGLYARICRIWS